MRSNPHLSWNRDEWAHKTIAARGIHHQRWVRNPRNPQVAYVRKGYSSTLRRLAMASLYHLKHSMSTAQLPLQHSIAGNPQSHIANRRRTEGSPGSAHQPCDSSKHACQLQATPGCEPRPEVNVMSWPYGAISASGLHRLLARARRIRGRPPAGGELSRR